MHDEWSSNIYWELCMYISKLLNVSIIRTIYYSPVDRNKFLCIAWYDVFKQTFEILREYEYDMLLYFPYDHVISIIETFQYTQ